MAEPKLVGTLAAAREIGVAYGTLSTWAKEGKVSATARTAGGHHRWDVADLRRQLNTSLERTAVDPIRSAYAVAVGIIRGLDDPHVALAIVGALVAGLQEMSDNAVTLRSDIVQRVYQQDELALKPLAEKVNKSQARRRREER